MSVIIVSDNSFQNELSKKPPLLLAEFSRPGKDEGGYDNQSARMGLIIDKLATPEEFGGSVVMVRVPMDDCSKTVKEYSVKRRRP
ncbi:hypothetical protein [Pseudomonas viridiflava]|uniref:Uncharacterized protein n=1 Tax=Pseudomonas viridiflava TaxID=33069 RepID=A0A1Y6JT41_PSEVI|nr:hypothetical protein [Pseudomonas viridiflava]MEE4142851.1 hypothetical protein [Pseudomonas viridiflava]MEE4156462.1 hypothetical protein [Pseudomonas viridiflava]SMS12301.1 hypothetical protein CFBP1590__4715 [Pseudomonas viridiflava]VVN76722.1 hypothetical protein PS689_00783 [Pseudomonas fluorescens]